LDVTKYLDYMDARQLMHAVFVEGTTAHVLIALVFPMVKQNLTNAEFATAKTNARIAAVSHMV
jgi:hypothetical protein